MLTAYIRSRTSIGTFTRNPEPFSPLRWISGRIQRSGNLFYSCGPLITRILPDLMRNKESERALFFMRLGGLLNAGIDSLAINCR